MANTTGATMTDDELVEQLREFADDGYPELSIAAADRIEALTADNARLRERAKDVDWLLNGDTAYERSGLGPRLRAALNTGKEDT